MMNVFTFLLFGFAGPLLIWPIEIFLPFPAIVEELYKLVLIYWIYYSELRSKTPQSLTFYQVVYVIIFGVVFTLTESVLYLFNFSLLNSFNLFPIRLLFTGTLHITTALVLLLGVKHKKLGTVSALLIAVGIHHLYNTWIAQLLPV